MQPYQEEYIANSREFNALTVKHLPEDRTFADYAARLNRFWARKTALAERNMALLREHLMPTLDHLPNADEETLAELAEYAGKLFNGRDGLDLGQFCLIHRSLLSLARQRNDRKAVIRELYWLGIGYHAFYSSRLAGVDSEYAAPYQNAMRLCFAEASAYLKYFDEIRDTDTRSYIMRSLANVAMGESYSVSARISLLKRALLVFQDPYYREKEPGLPWDRYVRQAHQLMTSGMSHDGSRAMTPQDVSEIMESAHIIYHEREEEAERKGEPLPAQQVFRTASIEYFCGILNLDGFLSTLERQMDAADVNSFSDENAYRLISLPAFYCLYLSKHREALPSREDYLAQLYRRIMDYMDAVPEKREDDLLFLYLRQQAAAFLESEHAISFGMFLARTLGRFAPEVYVHSSRVAKGAEALCGLILDEEPAFFDDIDFIREIPDKAEKREAALAYARGCGQFHDVGKINFLELYTRTARQWLEEEYEIARLHTVRGAAMLSERESTRRYAPAALGHHAWYDGSRGYPDCYRRLECRSRQMVDVIALVDWLASAPETGKLRRGRDMTFDGAVQEAIAQEGRRFSPLLTARLRDAGVAGRIREALEQGRQEAYRMLYERKPGGSGINPASKLPGRRTGRTA